MKKTKTKQKKTDHFKRQDLKKINWTIKCLMYDKGHRLMDYIQFWVKSLEVNFCSK